MSNQALDTVKAFLSNVFDADGININQIDDYFAADCVFHDAQPGLEGTEGYKQLLTMFESVTETVGGAQQPIVMADGDFVSVRWINKIRHTGELFGVPATGRTILSKGHETYRVQDGKIVENWGIMDVAGMVAQLTA